MTEDLIQIGRTLKTHGIGGELRVSVEENYWDDFEALEAVFLPIRQVPSPFFIEGMRGSFPDVIVKFEEVTNREDALALANKPVFARADKLTASPLDPNEDGESFVFLVGFTAHDEHEGLLGEITEVVEYPGQEMATLIYQGKEVLVPMNEAYITKIDEPGKTVWFDLPEGMLEL